MIEKSRAPRKVAIAEHLWEVFELMAQEMGSDREALVNQAMFMFARLNGYLTAGQASVGAAASPSLAEAGRPRVAPAPEPDDDDDLVPSGAVSPLIDDSDTPARSMDERETAGASPSPRGGIATAAGGAKSDPARRRQVEERVLETAAQLERQIRGRNELNLDPDENVDEIIDDELVDDDLIVDELMGSSPKKSLYLMTAEGELDKVAKERFVIGRGKHCDFVVQSGKVSREHAVITTESDGYFIEDLGSSNGTWFQKQRLKRRQIEDGDEYYICSEKIKCVIR